MVEFEKIKRGQWMIHYYRPTGKTSHGPFETKADCKQFHNIALFLSGDGATVDYYQDLPGNE